MKKVFITQLQRINYVIRMTKVYICFVLNLQTQDSWFVLHTIPTIPSVQFYRLDLKVVRRTSLYLIPFRCYGGK